MKFIDNLEKEEYENFVKSYAKTHFLQSYYWGQASKTRGLIPHYVGIKENDKLVATALLLEKKLLFGYTHFYIPRGYIIDYNNIELLTLFTNEIKKYTKKRKSLYFKIDPDIKLHNIDKDAKVIDDNENNYELVENLKKIGFKHEKLNLYFENMQPRFTFRVPISDDTETIRKRYSKSVLRWIKQADKYGVEVKIGDKEDLKEFIRLMKMTEKRQGFYSHDANFYEPLYDLFSEENHIHLYMASIDLEHVYKTLNEEIETCEDEEKKKKLTSRLEFYKGLKYKDNKINVSSYVNICYGDKSWYLYGANDMNFKDTFANYKLFDFQIQKSKEFGMKIFDEFGTIGDPNSTRSVAGLHEFKKKFGGEYTEFIGEFTYVTKPFMNFIFRILVPIYRKIGKFFRILKGKFYKSN